MANAKKKIAKKKPGRPANVWKQIENNFDFTIPGNAKLSKSFITPYDVMIQRQIKETYKHGLIKFGKYFQVRKKVFKKLSVGISTTSKPVLVLAMDNDYFKDSVPVKLNTSKTFQSVWNYALVDYILNALRIPKADKKESITIYFNVEQEPGKNIFILKQITS